VSLFNSPLGRQSGRRSFVVNPVRRYPGDAGIPLLGFSSFFSRMVSVSLRAPVSLPSVTVGG